MLPVDAATVVNRPVLLSPLPLATIALGGAFWSAAEWVDLVATSAVRFARPSQLPLFLLTHLGIGIAACLVMVLVLELGARLVVPVVRRLLPGRAWAEPLGTGLVLFGLHALIWAGACVTGLAYGSRVAAVIGIGALVPLVVLVKGRLPWRRTVPLRWEAQRAAGFFALVLLLHLFNRTWNSKIYFPVHVAGALYGLSAALYGAAHLWRAVGRPADWRPLSLVRGVGLAVAVLVAPPLLFSASNDVRNVLFSRAFDTKSILYVARKLRGVGFDERLPPAPRLATGWPAARARRVERVLLITIDAMRADHLPTYGYHRDTAPHITRFARQAATFDWAWAAAAKTVLALQAILTEASPRPSLARTLDGAGVPRVAVVRQDLEGHTANFQRTLVVGGDDDARLADSAIQEIEGGRFAGLMWVHFYDPHQPYTRRPESTFGDADVDLYDGEIASSDRAVGRLLDALERAHLSDSTAVLLAADHGEEFGEHGGAAHGWDVFNELMRVPLIIRIPGAQPRRLDTHVSQFDIAPTIQDLLGLGGDRHARDHSLVPLVLGQEHEDDRVTMVGPISTFGVGAVLSGRWKLTYCLFNHSYALYDLVEDRGERLNLFEVKPQVSARLEGMLEKFLADPYRLGPAFTASDGELGWKRAAAIR